MYALTDIPLTYQLLYGTSSFTHNLLHTLANTCCHSNLPCYTWCSLLWTSHSAMLCTEHLSLERICTTKPSSYCTLHTCTSKDCLSLRISTISSEGQWVIEKFKSVSLAVRSVKPPLRARLLIIDQRNLINVGIEGDICDTPTYFPGRRETTINKLRTELVCNP